MLRSVVVLRSVAAVVLVTGLVGMPLSGVAVGALLLFGDDWRWGVLGLEMSLAAMLLAVSGWILGGLLEGLTGDPRRSL